MAFPSPISAGPRGRLASRIAASPGDVWAAMRRVPLTSSVALLLLISQIVTAILPESMRLALAGATSTNITHLTLDPGLVLPASVFVTVGNEYIWVPLTFLLLGGLERRLGLRRTLMVTFGVHVVATLISEGLLLLQIAYRLQARALINTLDVGPSYVMLAALAGCLVIGNWRLRIAAFITGVLIVPGLLVDLPDLDMSSVGHFSSLVLGAGLAGWYAVSHRRAPAHRIRGLAAELADQAAPALARVAHVVEGAVPKSPARSS